MNHFYENMLLSASQDKSRNYFFTAETWGRCFTYELQILFYNVDRINKN